MSRDILQFLITKYQPWGKRSQGQPLKRLAILLMGPEKIMRPNTLQDTWWWWWWWWWTIEVVFVFLYSEVFGRNLGGQCRNGSYLYSLMLPSFFKEIYCTEKSVKYTRLQNCSLNQFAVVVFRRVSDRVSTVLGSYKCSSEKQIKRKNTAATLPSFKTLLLL